MYVKLNGEMVYLWRAVDSATLAFMKKALKRHDRAEAIVTDGPKSYPKAMRELGNLDRGEMDRWDNNRAENSHLPFRRRERDAQVQANEDAAKIRLGPRQCP